MSRTAITKRNPAPDVIDAEFEDVPLAEDVGALGFTADTAKRLGFYGLAREFDEGFAILVQPLDPVRKLPVVRAFSRELSEPCLVTFLTIWGDGKAKPELQMRFACASVFFKALADGSSS